MISPLAQELTDGAWILNADERAKAWEAAGFDAKVCDGCETAMQAIAASPDARAQFLDETRRYLSGEIPASSRSSDVYWCALMVAAGFPKMFSQHARRQVPLEVTRATARDLSRWIEDLETQRIHRPGFPLSWFHNHLRNGLLEIGRLQFVAGVFPGPVRIYSSIASPEKSIALAPDGIACGPDGWPTASNPVFVTSFRETSSDISGHQADPVSGRYPSRAVTLGVAEWCERLRRGDTILDVHVPSGAPLTPDECGASFERAKDLFEKCFPEKDWKAFVCTSWLLDRDLPSCLPPASGIVAFGARFLPFPPRETNFDQLRERVFAGASDIRHFPARTSLQKAAKAHLLKGGSFRTTCGYILREGQPLKIHL